MRQGKPAPHRGKRPPTTNESNAIQFIPEPGEAGEVLAYRSRLRLLQVREKLPGETPNIFFADFIVFNVLLKNLLT